LAQYKLIIVPTFEWADNDVLDVLERYARNGGRVLCGPRWPRVDAQGHPLTAWRDLPQPPIRSVPRLEFASGKVTPGLWAEDVDLWGEVAPGTAENSGRVEAAAEAIDVPFAHRVPYGSGSITLVAAAFPRLGAIEDATPAIYAAWVPWLLALMSASDVTPKWRCSNQALDVSILSGGGRRLVCIANPQREEQAAEISVPDVSAWRDVDVPGDQGTSTGSTLRVRLSPWSVKIWEVES
jgi:hypothetical protein